MADAPRTGKRLLYLAGKWRVRVGNTGNARTLAELLAGLDVPGVAAGIEAADLDDLSDEEELYDLELLEPEEASTTIAADLLGLIAFYQRVAASRLGVVSYTS